MKEDPKPEGDTPKPSRRSSRTTKPAPADGPASQEAPTKADSETSVVTPKKETGFKVPLPPAKPRKTFPPPPPAKKRSSATKSAPGSIPTNQPVPEKIPKDDEIRDKVVTQIEDFGVPDNQTIELGFFEPDGITRDIYVQGSK